MYTCPGCFQAGLSSLRCRYEAPHGFGGGGYPRAEEFSAERQGQNARQVLASIAGKIAETEIGISVVTLIELAHGAMRAGTSDRKAKRFNLIASF